MSMRTRAGKKISLTNYEELLAVPTIEGASDIPLDQLHEFKPNMFLEFSNYRAWWKCHVCGYEWQAPIANRSGGSECMCCSGMRLEAGINDLATTNPELAEEWSVQNGDLTPAMYKENSREMIWWTCRECGNEWRASIYSRSRGRICPYCSEKIRRENSVFRYRYRRDMMRFENNIRTAVIRFYMKKYSIRNVYVRALSGNRQTADQT